MLKDIKMTGLKAFLLYTFTIVDETSGPSLAQKERGGFEPLIRNVSSRKISACNLKLVEVIKCPNAGQSKLILSLKYQDCHAYKI